ncbi:insulinase family protein [Taibaiella lutea]|uniref:Insulinase family protein n=1 Tax=Taibaiella lutea TaxID=2608001 RepID=A0A5M6CEK5_9BACT|nr:pitrilysin family protein [Taibaiella lutea]KAA5533628.1 insulinase family protein [Taibaiella lutea]
MINRKVAPPIHDAISFEFKLQDIQKEIFQNNVPLWWLNAGTQDVIQLDWVFDAGLWHEQQTSVAQAVAAILRNGTHSRSAKEINEAIEFFGASLKVSPNNDYTIISLHTLSKHLGALLPVIREIITEAAFAEQELEIYKINAQQRLAVNLRQCEFVANRHIDVYLFGKQHPYGRFTEPADLIALNSANLIDFHKHHYKANNCKMFMAGKIGKAEVALVNEYFGKENWGGTEATPIMHHTLTPAAEKKHSILNDETGVQAAIRIARDFPTRSHPDFTPMIVLNTIFGGYFGSRLMANIREEKGYTYGIYSQIYNYKHAGALLIGTEAGRDVSRQTVEEVYKEMDIICSERVDEEELLLVQNYLLGNLLGDLDGPFSILQRWKNLILNDFTVEHFNQNIEIYKTITPAKLQELAQRYLNKEDYYELVVI